MMDGWVRGRLAESEGERTLDKKEGPKGEMMQRRGYSLLTCDAATLAPSLGCLPRNRVLPQRTVEAEHPHDIPQQKAYKVSKFNVVPASW